jgi:uncharacterized membrane protein YcaP (DUF421 family)
MKEIFLEIDWNNLLFGSENWDFLFETAFRSVIMFLVILFSLRLLGKRGVKQLSVFELGVIIGLGSAAGDPMFYKDVGLLPGMIVFTIIISLYRLITFFINRSERFENFVEGTPTCIVKEGKLLMQNFKQEPIARDELFSQLRLHSVAHLGQVYQAIMETNGEVSIFYYADEEVRYGLPIIPEETEQKMKTIKDSDYYSCHFCGHTENIKPSHVHSCSICHKNEWVKAINLKRIT